jgi:uncharacterized membrane protein YphA (DoxX/SURF4 family)
MKSIGIICRILLGLVFIFSGFVKGVDPMGGAIKFGEYFEAFHWSWLEGASLVIAIALSTAEFLIGAALLIGLRMRVTAWAALLFMSFFLILTFYIALRNPVTDCGCFGDALVITNWQTFYKNIILIALAGVIFYCRNLYVPYSKCLSEWLLVVFFAITGVGVSVYCYNHLPIMDFRPFHVGAHLPSQMTVPAGAPTDQYDTRLLYQKNGVVKEFTLQNYPWQDTTWKWKETKTVLVKKGYVTPIHGFSITSASGEDVTQKVLADTSYTFVFVIHNASKVAAANWQKLQAYYKFSVENNHKFYALSSATQVTTSKIKADNHLLFEFHNTDETALKTIVRANPGLVLLKDGVVIGLWHYNDMPELAYFKGNILSKVMTDYNKTIEWKRVSILALGFIIIILLLLLGRNRMKF